MADAFVLDMPMEFRLEIVAVIGSEVLNAERKGCNDTIHEIDGVGLVVAFVDFQGADTCGIINGRVMKARDCSISACKQIWHAHQRLEQARSYASARTHTTNTIGPSILH